MRVKELRPGDLIRPCQRGWAPPLCDSNLLEDDADLNQVGRLCYPALLIQVVKRRNNPMGPAALTLSAGGLGWVKASWLEKL